MIRQPKNMNAILKHKEILKVVRLMIASAKYKVSDKEVIEKFINEFYNVNNKVKGDTVNIICQAFECLRSETETVKILNGAFFKNDRLANIVLFCIPTKIDLLKDDVRVCVEMFTMEDIYVCKQCHVKLSALHMGKKWKRVKNVQYVAACESYWFACSYVCDMCFTNKLYKEL
ncbi:ORF_98 [Adoxophyes orana granulovirus]|uniref:ADOR98 n=1 Tax=Adoxophyes orana granulovirus TaxID=170617 RepID=Q7T9R7_GVAO|nr:ORF_98 [Adoxophyes orana granulovirus]AAP85735.1 ORF_98 [Adoxophyes orana granulovirus]AJA91738.1 ADOR98 [Adoxophyes orana granulovirus]